ncbi:MAG: hypothetical protein WBF08_02895 [Candidatus Bathyarchaeia archaeon]
MICRINKEIAAVLLISIFLISIMSIPNTAGQTSECTTGRTTYYPDTADNPAYEIEEWGSNAPTETSLGVPAFPTGIPYDADSTAGTQITSGLNDFQDSDRILQVRTRMDVTTALSNPWALAQQNYHFTINEPVEYMTSIIIEVELGDTGDPNSPDHEDDRVQVKTDTGYESLGSVEGHYVSCAGTWTVQLEDKFIDSNFENYLDDSNKLYVRAYSYHRNLDGGTVVSMISVDLVRVTVTTCCPTTETVYASIEMLSGDVHTIVGGTSGDVRLNKPAGTAYAAWIDSTGGGVLLGMSENGHFCWDTDTAFIDQTTGEPTGVPSGGTLVLSGGPIVNGPVKYYELNRATENTPAYYAKVSGLMSFLRSSDDQVLASLTPTDTHDMFIIEIFQDSDSRTVIIVYGFAGRGTLAGALYFVDNADVFDGNTGYWIYEWTDNPTDGTLTHPDPPGTDVFTLITSGP